jgi:hypothetical protein
MFGGQIDHLHGSQNDARHYVAWYGFNNPPPGAFHELDPCPNSTLFAIEHIHHLYKKKNNQSHSRCFGADKVAHFKIYRKSVGSRSMDKRVRERWRICAWDAKPVSTTRYKVGQQLLDEHNPRRWLGGWAKLLQDFLAGWVGPVMENCTEHEHSGILHRLRGEEVVS